MIKTLKIEKADKQQTLVEGGWTLAFHESRGQLCKGDQVLVYLWSDEKGQHASMKIYNHLQTTEDHRVGDKVDFIVYDLKDEMGALCAVDDRIHGLIPKNELYREVRVGARLQGRVTKVNEGKLRLSIREKAADQLDIDMQTIMTALQKGDGVLFLNDDSEPEQIKRKLNMSKKAFKRATGRLLSEGKIDMFEDGIKLL